MFAKLFAWFSPPEVENLGYDFEDIAYDRWAALHPAAALKRQLVSILLIIIVATVVALLLFAAGSSEKHSATPSLNPPQICSCDK